MVKQPPVATMSSKGQIVIPLEVRQSAGVQEGSRFVVFAAKNAILLKPLELPSAENAFEEFSRLNFARAKELGLKESDVESIIHRRRGVKD